MRASLLLFLITIPFRYTPGQIEVQVSIDGRAPLWCIVDSGSEFSILDKETAAALKLIGDERVEHVTWTIGALTMRDQTMRLWALDNFRRQKREIRGLIGCELFERYAVTIDYDKRELILREPSELRPPPNAMQLPIVFSGRLPVIRAKLNKTLVTRLMVDTGASQAVILRHPFASEHHLFSGHDAAGTSESLAAGPRSFVNLPPAELTIGTRTFPDLNIQAYGTPQGAGGDRSTDGLLGNAVLQHFRVTFDYAHKRIVLETPAQN